MIYLTNIDLKGNALNNSVLDSRSQDPISPKEGQIWFNNTEDIFKFFDGASIQKIESWTFIEGKLALLYKALDEKKTDKIIDGKPLITENNKINEELIPDSVRYQDEYIGKFESATSENQLPEGRIPQKGWYFVCKDSGNYNPDGTLARSSRPIYIEGDTCYNPGDLAIIIEVIPAAGGFLITWEKIDHSDAVKQVNGKIGSVYTYLGEWVPSVKYFCGDMISFESAVFVCVKETQSEVFDYTSWKCLNIKAGTGLTYNNNGNILNHSNSIAAGRVGGGAGIAQISYDTEGHITNASSIKGDANSYLSSNDTSILWKAPVTEPSQISETNNTLVSASAVAKVLGDWENIPHKYTENNPELVKIEESTYEWIINHGLNKKDVQVELFRINNDQSLIQVLSEIYVIDENNIKVIFNLPLIVANTFKVVVIG